jgi:hypothetical protein
MYDLIDYLMAIIMGFLVILLVILIGAVVYGIMHPDPPCAVGHYETRSGIMWVNKVAIPTTYRSYVCDVYETSN